MSEGNRRVLVLNHFAAPRGEAGGTRHVELFGRLEGWDHLIIASDLNPLSGNRVAGEPGFAVVSVPDYSSNGARRIWNWAAYALRATLLGLRQRKVDLVYGSSPHLLAALAAWAIAQVRRKPFILEVRDLWPQVLLDMGQLNESSIIYKALTVLETFLYSRARAIVVMAEGTRAVLIGRGIAEEKIHYVPNGADPEDFIPSAPREVLRTRYEFKRFTAIYTGAHGPANGLNLLLDAAAKLIDDDFDIVLVGGGVEKEKLIERAERESLANVRFLAPVAKTEVPDLLAAADLGLHVLADVPLFQTAVSPNKVFDYMAAGLPVLTNCPGLVTRLVHEAGAGVGVLPNGLAEGLAAARQLSREGHGSDGLEWIGVHQSRTAMSRRLSAVFAQVCDD